MAGTLNKFISNMLLSGIVTQERGVNYMWHNPFVFWMSKPFAVFIKELRKDVVELDEILYYLGVLQGRNSTKMLKDRFGYDKNDLASFIDGATIIGMGELTLTDNTAKFMSGHIEGIDSTHAVRVRESIPSNKACADSYLAGILAGGAEVLLNRPYLCTEQWCMAKGDPKCVYYLEANKQFKYKRFKPSKYAALEKKITAAYLNMKAFIRISLFKKFSFDNGAFYLNKVEGYNIEVYLVLLLEQILMDSHPAAYRRAARALYEESISMLIDGRRPFSQKEVPRVFYD